ncbi:hypothetical protein BDW60DRAFT_216777 [Aspergillus nidulans var. acristatus]
MRLQSLQNIAPADIHIKREINRSEASSVYEIELDGATYAMKLFHDNGDPGYTKKGRDLNRFRCELNAYRNLHARGVCQKGFVPFFYGHIDQLDPSALNPPLEHFLRDKNRPSAIILEYLANAESLNCVNYSEDRYSDAIDGIKAIHAAFVLHQDIYPKNILITPDRMVWMDFDVATTFSEMGTFEKEQCRYETELVVNFGEKLRRDQKRGEAPNLHYY